MRSVLSWVSFASLVALAVVCAVPLGPRGPTPAPAIVHGRAALTERSEGRLRAGAARVAIALPPEASLAGYPGFRSQRGEADDVYARALVIEAGDARQIVVALDALLVPGELEEEVLRRGGLSAQTCLLFAATHTHSGPGGTWSNALASVLGNGLFDRAQRDAVAHAAATAIAQASGALAPARLAIARAPWRDGPAVARSEGPIDPQLVVLQARREDGSAIATLLVYGMHPTVLPRSSRRLSGDWPGAAAQTLEGATHAPALVLQGAGGNATWNDAGIPGDPTLAARALGGRVAAQGLRLLSVAQELGRAPLSCSVRLLSLPAPEAGARVPRMFRTAAGNLFALFAEPWAVQSRLGVGPLALIGVPGEPVGALGLSVQPAQLVGLADGYVGYVETPERARGGQGESQRTYHGPSLADALGLIRQSKAESSR